MSADVRYVVEWCSEIPLTPDGDSDLDRAVYEKIRCANFKEAVRKAKLIVARRDDAFGCPCIEEHIRYEIEPGVWSWRLAGTLHVSDWHERCALADFDRRYCESD